MTPAPFYDDVADGPPGGRAVWLTASDGVRIRAAHWPGGARGTVVIVPGRTECIEKYGPVAADMVAAGYHAVAIDVRGQGLAARLLPDAMVGHVGHFLHYTKDMQALLPLLDELPQPRLMLAHSMGGTIGLRALVQGFPVARAAFSAPMWGIGFSRGMAPLARGVAALATLFGRGGRYAPGTGPAAYLLTAPFRGNTLTTDEATWDWMKRQVQAHPDLALGGPSFAWVQAALAECRALARLPAPDVPALAILGSAEKIVDPQAIQRRMATWPGSRLLILPGAEHEVLMEAPRLRAEAMRAVLDHFAGV
ncbi:MAG: alpha/beta fold hydrolase [Gemmobacter sp.]